MAEYIDREAVLEAAKKSHLYFDIKPIINSIPAADVRPVEWIPVTERLPEEKTYVLILFDTIAGKMQGVCFLYKDDDGHNCWTWLDRLGKNLFDIQPTHWMPLPQPPEEE